MRGYSGIIQEALDYYIAHQTKVTGAKRDILKMKGNWRAEEEKEMRSKLTELRENWKQL